MDIAVSIVSSALTVAIAMFFIRRGVKTTNSPVDEAGSRARDAVLSVQP